MFTFDKNEKKSVPYPLNNREFKEVKMSLINGLKEQEMLEKQLKIAIKEKEFESKKKDIENCLTFVKNMNEHKKKMLETNNPNGYK
jgi:hypothetical protein